MSKKDSNGQRTFWSVTTHKKCPRCKKTKPLSQFHKNKCKKYGIGSYCKKCRALRCEEEKAKGIDYGRRRRYYETNRWVQLKKQFGIDKKTYEKMHNEQSGLCAICGNPETFVWRGTVKRLAVDHDHKTGVIRGLLCTACNKGLGCFRDNPEWLLNAVAYLRLQRSG